MLYQLTQYIESDVDGNISIPSNFTGTIEWTDDEIENGKFFKPLYYKAYYKNGVMHKENGPALIQTNSRGVVEYKEYWKNGVQVEPF